MRPDRSARTSRRGPTRWARGWETRRSGSRAKPAPPARVAQLGARACDRREDGGSKPPVATSTDGSESAGDDAALIRRRASFDTRRADTTLVAPDGTGPGPLLPTEPVRDRPPALGTLATSRPHGGWSRMERRVVVTHPAGSSILLIHAAGRDGDLTGFIRPTISGQYGALRLAPEYWRGLDGSIIVHARCRPSDVLAPVAQAPVAQTEEAAGSNPARARSNRAGGTTP